MKKRYSLSFILVLLLLFGQEGVMAQAEKKETAKTARNWQGLVREKPFAWYKTDEAQRIASNVLIKQHECGGWEKNDDLEREFSGADESDARKNKDNIHDVTIDNGATTTELRFLANIYRATLNEEYKKAFQRGIQFLFDMQMPNGGWPQYYNKKGYYMHITYNDDAMINVMLILKRISDKDTLYSGLLPDAMLAQAKQAFDKGVDCILKTQIVVNGKPTVWCAQHDEVTLKPAKARAYELPSFSGKESVELVKMLLTLPNPSPEIAASIDGAMAWLEANKITGKKMVYFTNSDGRRDRKLVDDPAAEPLWARFYTLEDAKPFVCDRDGVKKFDLLEIGYERRNGYSWYADWAKELFPKYDRWKKKLAKTRK